MKTFWTTDANGQWDAGWTFLYLPGNNTEAILFWSRLPIILIALALGFMIFKWAKELFGTKAGLARSHALCLRSQYFGT